ncbi:hypothetical protein D3C80_1451680 [compost metagenome]
MGIEQRLRQAAGEALEHFEVFAAGMEYLDHRRRFEHGGERRPVADQQRVDQPGPLAVAHLHQAGCRIEGIDTHELGIEGEVRPLLPVPALLRKAGIVANPLDIECAHEHLPGFKCGALYRAGRAHAGLFKRE